MSNRKVTFYHAPQSRSGATLTLMEELGADYELKVLNLKKEEQRGAAYLAINPMGKVPAIVHDGALITEQIAIYTYMADLYPEKGLAPAIGDPQRGPYLRWLAFYAGCFEPAIGDKFRKVDPGPKSSVPYGSFDDMLNTFVAQIEKGPYLLGERFTAADVLWGGAMAWAIGFGLVPKLPAIERYMARITERPAAKRAQEFDTKLIEQQAA